uniref:hypothetical protein n=1 Tax=Polynucleobacter sp. TaxID=2029855 RepID=UPI004048EA0A
MAGFDSEDEARSYVAKNADKNYQIKEKKSLTWVEYLTFAVAFLVVKFTGLLGGVCVAAGYYLYKYLSKKMNKFAAMALGSVVGLIAYLLIVAIIFS